MFGNIYRGKKVLVTGHTGFKGSWLSEWLLSLGAEVCGYSIDIPSEPSHFEILGLSKRMKHVIGDVRDKALLTKTLNDFNPDIVFHLAAQAIVSKSIHNPTDTFEVNAFGTMNLLEALRTQNSVAAAVFITSDKCYENVEWEYGYRENDRLGGKDPYSASKACAEIIFSAYARTFWPQLKSRIAATRAGNVIGGGDWAKDRIVPDCMRAWAKKESVSVRNPNATRPWQHVLEPLSGYLNLGQGLLENREGLHAESFNFGPASDVNQPVSVLITELQKTWSNTRVDLVVDPLAKKEAGLLKLCCDKALHRLNWKPTLNFSETIQFTAQWYRDFYESSPAKAVESTTHQIKAYAELAKSRGYAWAQS